ncbi:hypothetical protein S3E15_04750 [Bacillus mycoides]|uniref:Uncharacterized protein n=1 Tax=Bacillus mycoides TaxID=1405 RepID=A0AAP8BFQ2_BACMY|nr:hypothetical protein bmyco0001_31480 [Bacillus mycoides DSM 2048]KUH45202.1 hypothetical protein M2E15_3883 [Bacillus mycoides]KZD27940.1 hypothetical protein B4083_5456 [Bacillus cereus]KZE07513.1 hypothetical protein B4117_0666 [Bacillus mycoides]OSX88655.1 hypothetical protein BTJ44_04333 [Bacillus mycoides]
MEKKVEKVFLYENTFSTYNVPLWKITNRVLEFSGNYTNK